MQRPRMAVLVVLVSSTVTGCGSVGARPATTETEVVTATVTETVTVSPAVTAEPEPPPSSSGDDPTPVPVPPRGQELTLADFFGVDEGTWSEDRYTVAGRENVRGLSTPKECSTDSETRLELRLGNKFSTVSFSAGIDDLSDSAEVPLRLEVRGNGEQLEVRTVSFNVVQDFTVDVSEVNALVLTVGVPEGLNCAGGYDEARLVLSGFVLQ